MKSLWATNNVSVAIFPTLSPMFRGSDHRSRVSTPPSISGAMITPMFVGRLPERLEYLATGSTVVVSLSS